MLKLDEAMKQKIINVATALFPTAKIYLYGSRARKTNQQYSDIDIALDAGKKLPKLDVGELRDMFEASNIMLKIDVVDLHSVGDEMRERILEDGVLWKS